MRYIDLPSLLNKRASWGNSSDLWENKVLKEDFRQHSHCKCWYTEVTMRGSDTPIDHRRPKAEIKQYKHYNFNKPLKATGYHWLANDPSNYRLCCTYANRKTGDGGKSCFFPLSNTSDYLTANGTETETPLLLDPCNKDDVKLISFLRANIVPATTEPTEQERVKVSSDIYNMNDFHIKMGRQKIWDEVERIIDMYCSGYMNQYACVELLKDKIKRDAEFSACAIACVNSLAPKEITDQLGSLLDL